MYVNVFLIIKQLLPNAFLNHAIRAGYMPDLERLICLVRADSFQQVSIGMVRSFLCFQFSSEKQEARANGKVS